MPLPAASEVAQTKTFSAAKEEALSCHREAQQTALELAQAAPELPQTAPEHPQAAPEFTISEKRLISTRPLSLHNDVFVRIWAEGVELILILCACRNASFVLK